MLIFVSRRGGGERRNGVDKYGGGGQKLILIKKDAKKSEINRTTKRLGVIQCI